MTNHDRITKEFGKRWADMVFGKGEFERLNKTGIPTREATEKWLEKGRKYFDKVNAEYKKEREARIAAGDIRKPGRPKKSCNDQKSV